MFDTQQDTNEDIRPVSDTVSDELKQYAGKNLLDVLDQPTIDRIVAQTIIDRDAGKKHFEGTLERKYIERQLAFRSDKDDLKKRFPDLEMIIDITDSSVQDTVESIQPAIMKIFHSADKPLDLVGATEEDDVPSNTMELLIDYQLNRKNRWWLTSYDWTKCALIENMSFLKVWWKRETKVVSYESVVDNIELEAIRQDPKNSIVSEEENQPNVFHVVYKKTKLSKNHPVVEACPNSEIYYDPNCKNLDDANYVIHHKTVNLSFLRQEEKSGKFSNVSEVAENTGDVRKGSYETTLYPDNQDQKTTDDKGRRELKLYECYEKITLDEKEGSLADLIVTLANDIPVRIEINTMGSHPFIDISAMRDPHRIQAHRGIADLVREIQDLRSVLLLQMVMNTCINNDRQAFIDSDKLVDANELKNNDKVVRVEGDPRSVVSWSPTEPFSPQVLALMEYSHQLLENRVGVTRYNQGSDANSLNKTLGGLDRIMQAANQRIEMIARIFAETGYTKLFRRLIFLNQTFIDEETVIRVTNERMVIRPDDLAGEMDIIVNSGIGTGTKQAEMGFLQLMGQQYPGMFQIGIAKRKHAAYAASKLVELGGYKNTQDFVMKPEEVEAEDAQQAAIQNALNQIMPGASPTGGAGPNGGIDPQLIGQILARLGGAQGQPTVGGPNAG
jgi:hypothetical protein